MIKAIIFICIALGAFLLATPFLERIYEAIQPFVKLIFIIFAAVLGIAVTVFIYVMTGSFLHGTAANIFFWVVYLTVLTRLYELLD